MDEKVEKIIYLIHISDLDETVKNVLIQTLAAEGLTDFIKEQIRAYCYDGLQAGDQKVEEAKQILDEQNK